MMPSSSPRQLGWVADLINLGVSAAKIKSDSRMQKRQLEAERAAQARADAAAKAEADRRALAAASLRSPTVAFQADPPPQFRMRNSAPSSWVLPATIGAVAVGVLLLFRR